MNQKLEAFRTLLERQQAERYARDYPASTPPSVTIKQGKRWTRVDVGDSGKYLVDLDGAIVGIKAYGVPHFGHRYGTLDIINEWNWSDYAAIPLRRTA